MLLELLVALLRDLQVLEGLVLEVKPKTEHDHVQETVEEEEGEPDVTEELLLLRNPLDLTLGGVITQAIDLTYAEVAQVLDEEE